MISQRKHQSDIFDNMDSVMRIFEKTIDLRAKEEYNRKYPDIVEWNRKVDEKNADKRERRRLRKKGIENGSI